MMRKGSRREGREREKGIGGGSYKWRGKRWMRRSEKEMREKVEVPLILGATMEMITVDDNWWRVKSIFIKLTIKNTLSKN